MTPAPRRAAPAALLLGAVTGAALAACPNPLVGEGPSLSHVERMARDVGPSGRSPDERPWCASPPAPPSEPLSIDVTLVAGPDLWAETWVAFREAAHLWSSVGVTLCAAEQTAEVPPGPLVLRRSSAPLAALLASLPAESDTVSLGVVNRLAAPDAEVLHRLGALDGLGLPGRPNEVTTLLGVAPRPIAVLRADTASQPRPRDLAAHELGHALGLEHHPDDDNLMHPERRPGCRPVLTPQQLDAIRAELASWRRATRTSRSSRRACPS